MIGSYPKTSSVSRITNLKQNAKPAIRPTVNSKSTPACVKGQTAPKVRSQYSSSPGDVKIIENRTRQRIKTPEDGRQYLHGESRKQGPSGYVGSTANDVYRYAGQSRTPSRNTRSPRSHSHNEDDGYCVEQSTTDVGDMTDSTMRKCAQSSPEKYRNVLNDPRIGPRQQGGRAELQSDSARNKLTELSRLLTAKEKEHQLLQKELTSAKKDLTVERRQSAAQQKRIDSLCEEKRHLTEEGKRKDCELKSIRLQFNVNGKGMRQTAGNKNQPMDNQSSRRAQSEKQNSSLNERKTEDNLWRKKEKALTAQIEQQEATIGVAYGQILNLKSHIQLYESEIEQLEAANLTERSEYLNKEKDLTNNLRYLQEKLQSMEIRHNKYKEVMEGKLERYEELEATITKEHKAEESKLLRRIQILEGNRELNFELSAELETLRKEWSKDKKHLDEILLDLKKFNSWLEAGDKPFTKNSIKIKELNNSILQTVQVSMEEKLHHWTALVKDSEKKMKELEERLEKEVYKNRDLRQQVSEYEQTLRQEQPRSGNDAFNAGNRCERSLAEEGKEQSRRNAERELATLQQELLEWIDTVEEQSTKQPSRTDQDSRSDVISKLNACFMREKTKSELREGQLLNKIGRLKQEIEELESRLKDERKKMEIKEEQLLNKIGRLKKEIEELESRLKDERKKMEIKEDQLLNKIGKLEQEVEELRQRSQDNTTKDLPSLRSLNMGQQDKLTSTNEIGEVNKVRKERLAANAGKETTIHDTEKESKQVNLAAMALSNTSEARTSPDDDEYDDDDDITCSITDSKKWSIGKGHTSKGAPSMINYAAVSLFNSDKESETRRAPKGIRNLGNTCYFAAVAQNLAQTQLLTDEFLSVHHKVRAKDAQNASLIRALQEFLSIDNEREGDTYFQRLFYTFCNKLPKFANKGQHDSHEFLNKFLSCLRDEERNQNPANQSESRKTLTSVDKVFGGHIITVYNCLDCYTPYHICEPFSGLSLPVCIPGKVELVREMFDSERRNQRHFGEDADFVRDEMRRQVIKATMTPLGNRHLFEGRSPLPGTVSIGHCLSYFTRVEGISDEYLCQDCQTRNPLGQVTLTSADKRTLIYDPPAVLVFHLKRFEETFTGFRKRDDFVSYEELLDIGPYCSSTCLRIDEKDRNVWYSLYGVVVHKGTLLSGHYYAYVKVRQGDSRRSRQFLQESLLDRDNVLSEEDVQGIYENVKMETTKEDWRPGDVEGRWYCVDDNYVRETTKTEVLSQTAYMLFYERIGNKKE